MNNNQPEVKYLREKVHERYGRRLATTTDFESLSMTIEIEIKERISTSTLKRIWNYISDVSSVRESTLDILSRYVGFNGYSHFCEYIRALPGFNSEFFSAECVTAAGLRPGMTVTIGWMPDRLVTLRYEGEDMFVVTEVRGSKLRCGDVLKCSVFMTHMPLYVSGVFRDGAWTSPYVAGLKGGLTVLTVE